MKCGSRILRLSVSMILGLFAGCAVTNHPGSPKPNDSEPLPSTSPAMSLSTDSINAFSQATKTLSATDIESVLGEDTICWGRIDDCDLYGIAEISQGEASASACEYAMIRHQPVWRCFKDAAILLGKVDFMMRPSDKRVKLVFTEVKTQRSFQTELMAGISGASPFYVVLPRGVYRLQIDLLWEQYSYSAMSETYVISKGNRSITYIGDLRLGVHQVTPGDVQLGPGAVEMIFDTGNVEQSQAWFTANNPPFKGEYYTQRIVAQPTVVDQNGELYYWHKPSIGK